MMINFKKIVSMPFKTGKGTAGFPIEKWLTSTSI